MDIYVVLSSRPHNPHYLNRYIKFIKDCQQKNIGYEGYVEKHHICPKADDMFPEYICFSKCSWNKVNLTPRQHFIAHLLLRKVYPDIKSAIVAVFLMSYRDDNKLDSRTYARLSEEYSKNHHFLGGEIQRKTNKKRIDERTHHLLGGEIQRKTNKKRIDERTHHLLGGEQQRKVQGKLVKDGKHHFLGGEIQRESARKKVREGTHQCLGVVPCYDKHSNYVTISKEIYHSQKGPKEKREFVHVTSKEGKRRKSLIRAP